MTRKKSQMGRKYKGQSGNPKQRAAKAASDAATASTGVNPAPMGRPWPTKEGAAAMERPSPTQEAGAATASEKKKMLEALRQMNVDPTFAGLLLVWTMTTQRRLRSSCNKDE